MGRESYDDMVSYEKRSRKSSSRMTGLVAVLGILICAIALLAVLILSPQEESAQPESVQTPVTVEVREPEIIVSGTAAVQAGSDAEASGSQAETVIPDSGASSLPESAPAAETASAPAQASSSEPVRAIDLISAQNLASFNDSDRLLYLTHEVQEGETITSIAERYGLDPETIISVNRIRDISAVTAGARLEIPNMNGQVYIVQEGDMLSTIAHKFSPDLGWKTLMDINGLTSENITVGQEIFIPAAAQSSPASDIRSASLEFSSPADGTVYAGYGQYFNGVNLNGVLIGAPAGSAVRSCADGVIVDAGNSGEFGRFVAIQHDQGYMTRYYNLETVSAMVGSEVKAGDVIGAIGSSSQLFSRPTLYLQIEQGGITLNPELFI